MTITSSALTSSALTSPATTSPDAAAIAGVPTSTRTSDLAALPAALRSEWIKVSTLRANRVILALAVVVGGGIAAALAATATDAPIPAAELFVYPLPLVATMALVTGILMFTGEAQHGSLAVTLMARPARWVTVAAKTTTASVVGSAYAVVAMAAGFAGAALGGADAAIDSAVAARAGWALLYITLAANIGLGVGMIVRHSAGAVSGLLMWSFVVENLLAPALPDGVVHFLPFSAGYRLLDAGPGFEAPVVIAEQLGRPAYAAIFGGYAVLTLVIGTVMLTRRDSN